MFAVSVYPHNDNAMPFKLLFNEYAEMREYCDALENKKCDFFVMEFPNEVRSELD